MIGTSFAFVDVVVLPLRHLKRPLPFHQALVDNTRAVHRTHVAQSKIFLHSLHKYHNYNLRLKDKEANLETYYKETSLETLISNIFYWIFKVNNRKYV